MLRQAFTDRLKGAMKARDARTLSTVRLILASLKRARRSGARGGQCQGHRRAGNRPHVASDDQAAPRNGSRSTRTATAPISPSGERDEIGIIESFLPRQMSDDEIAAAAQAAIAETGALGIKDMGRVMAALRQRHAGAIDLGRAGAAVKRLLG